MRLSQEKRDKIAEQILSNLFHAYPRTFFTSEIAQELARDEEFIKSLLMDLKAKDLVASVKRTQPGYSTPAESVGASPTKPMRLTSSRYDFTNFSNH